MAKSKYNHKRRIKGLQPAKLKAVSPGMIVQFKYGGVSPYRNSIEYVTITTTGNASDFGDAVHHNNAHAYLSGTSDSHGGLAE